MRCEFRFRPTSADGQVILDVPAAVRRKASPDAADCGIEAYINDKLLPSPSPLCDAVVDFADETGVLERITR